MIVKKPEEDDSKVLNERWKLIKCGRVVIKLLPVSTVMTFPDIRAAATIIANRNIVLTISQLNNTVT